MERDCPHGAWGGVEGEGGGFNICHMSAPDYFVFKQKIYCSFLWMEGVEGHKIGHFLWQS